MSNLVADKVTTNQLMNKEGAELYTLHAWCTFTTMTTTQIYKSGNVSSLTDNGVGNTTINFIKPMAHDSYAVLGTVAAQGGTTQSGAKVLSLEGASKAASHNTNWVRVAVVDNNSDTMFDASLVSVGIVG